MKPVVARLFTFAFAALWLAPAVHAQEPAEPAAPDANTAVEIEVEAATQESEPNREREEGLPFRWRVDDDNVVVHVGEDAHLPQGERAETVVSVFGSASAEGDVHDAVVAVFGDARASGKVGNAVVAVFGNAYVDGPVGREAVVFLGDLTLGPNASIDGDVTVIGGRLIRDPKAVIEGKVDHVSFGENGVRLEWLRSWIKHCLLYGRLLAFEPSVSWVWGIAFGFLAFYVLLAVLFGDGVEKCVKTLETRPGESILAAVLSVLLTPLLFVALLITVIGVPALGLVLFVVGLFGKAVVLAWLGRRVTRLTGIGAVAHIAFAVFVGGLILMAIYLVPVISFVAYKATGILGTGVVIYTWLLMFQARRSQVPVAASGTAPAAAAPAPDAVAPSEAQATSSASASIAAPRAGFWIRMGALLIDVILISVVAAVIDPLGDIWLLTIAAYGALMWKLKGATIGASLLDLQVVRVDGREIGWDTATVRALGCVLSAIAAGLGFIWIAFDRDQQAWHDKIAGTVVVRKQKVASLATQT